MRPGPVVVVEVLTQDLDQVALAQDDQPIQAVAVLVLSFSWSMSRGVRIWSVVGLLSMLSAALGGFLFLRSGFADGGSSAQMGGSFIGAFASYFLVLYYTK